MKTCSCCGYKTLEDDTVFEVCEICSWQDDEFFGDSPDCENNVNRISLLQAQKNFIEFGACNKESIKYVRKPDENDKRDLNWKPVWELN